MWHDNETWVSREKVTYGWRDRNPECAPNDYLSHLTREYTEPQGLE